MIYQLHIDSRKAATTFSKSNKAALGISRIRVIADKLEIVLIGVLVSVHA